MIPNLFPLEVVEACVLQENLTTRLKAQESIPCSKLFRLWPEVSYSEEVIHYFW